MKRRSTFPRVPELEPPYQMQFSIIYQDTHCLYVWGVPFCRGAVGVSYSPYLLGSWIINTFLVLIFISLICCKKKKILSIIQLEKKLKKNRLFLFIDHFIHFKGIIQLKFNKGTFLIAWINYIMNTEQELSPFGLDDAPLKLLTASITRKAFPFPEDIWPGNTSKRSENSYVSHYH